MENFDALVQLLEGVDGITRCGEEQLPDVLKEMLDNPLLAHAQASRAQVALKAHYGATARTIRHDLHHAQDSRLTGGASVVFLFSSGIEWRGRA